MFILILFNYQHNVINWKSLWSIKATRSGPSVCVHFRPIIYRSINDRAPIFFARARILSSAMRAMCASPDHREIVKYYLFLWESALRNKIYVAPLCCRSSIFRFFPARLNKRQGVRFGFMARRALARGSKDERKGSASRGCFQTVIFDSV
jgi:hypothetical protein